MVVTIPTLSVSCRFVVTQPRSPFLCICLIQSKNGEIVWLSFLLHWNCYYSFTKEIDLFSWCTGISKSRSKSDNKLMYIWCIKNLWNRFLPRMKYIKYNRKFFAIIRKSWGIVHLDNVNTFNKNMYQQSNHYFTKQAQFLKSNSQYYYILCT